MLSGAQPAWTATGEVWQREEDGGWVDLVGLLPSFLRHSGKRGQVASGGRVLAGGHGRADESLMEMQPETGCLQRALAQKSPAPALPNRGWGCRSVISARAVPRCLAFLQDDQMVRGCLV